MRGGGREEEGGREGKGSKREEEGKRWKERDGAETLGPLKDGRVAPAGPWGKRKGPLVSVLGTFSWEIPSPELSQLRLLVCVGAYVCGSCFSVGTGLCPSEEGHDYPC